MVYLFKYIKFKNVSIRKIKRVKEKRMVQNNTKDNKNADSKNSYARKRKRWLSVTALVIAVIFVVWTVATSLMSVWAADGSSSSASGTVTKTSADDMRGIWVSTVMNLDYPSVKTTDAATLKAEADKILDNIKAMNMNTVFLQVRPCGDAFYKSDIFPWSSYISGTQGVAPAGGFDPLEYWVSAAHARGLELHAWINPYRITRGGDTEWNSLSADNPAKGDYADCVVKYSDGNYYYDPGNPKSVDLIVKGALEIVNNYDVDGIHMDDYFYPGTSFNDDASWNAYGSGYSDKSAWRRDNVNKLVAELDTKLHQADSSLRFGISPQGIWANSTTMPNGSATKGSEAYTQKFADCLAWINAGTIDYIVPQIYWNIGYTVADYSVLAKWWSDAVKGSDVDLYIGMADYRSSNVTDKNSVWYGTSELQRQLAINKADSNIKGEIHFRYKLMANDSNIVNLYTTYYANGGNGGSSAATPNDPDAGKNNSSNNTDSGNNNNNTATAPSSDPNAINITVNGKYIQYTDAAPFIDKNNRTLCPLRVVGDALGMDVEWENENRQAIFTRDSLKVVFTIDSNNYRVMKEDASGNFTVFENKTMDTEAIIKNSRTYAPVRYLAEAAGYKVDWDNSTRTVIIESN